MDKNHKGIVQLYLIAGVIVVVSLIVLVVAYFMTSSDGATDRLTGDERQDTTAQGSEQHTGTDQADANNEENTTVAIGTREVSSGAFVEVTDGEIYYASGLNVLFLPLTVDEVVLACTAQDLDQASELDFEQVTEIKVLTPDTLEENIPTNEPIVVFAADVNGELRAHTIAMSEQSCQE